MDIDFSDGSLESVDFLSTGNDAFDASGSNVSMTNISISGVGDKAISLGEMASLNASYISINNAEIAVASKDSSTFNGSQINIMNSKVPIAVFQKRPYGPAFATLKDSNLKTFKNNYILENQSSLRVNGISFSPNTDNASALMYGNLYGKITKK